MIYARRHWQQGIYLEAREPWHDAKREFSAPAGKHGNNSGVFDRYARDYDGAIDDVRALLADGKWHSTDDVRAIARSYGIKQVNLLMDRAGVYFEDGRCIWAGA